jgi:hypothetical protein
MNKVEQRAFMLFVALNLAELQKDQEVVLPLLLTFSDATAHVFGEFLWPGEKMEDIFGTGHNHWTSAKCRCPSPWRPKIKMARQEQWKSRKP